MTESYTEVWPTRIWTSVVVGAPQNRRLLNAAEMWYRPSVGAVHLTTLGRVCQAGVKASVLPSGYAVSGWAPR